MPFIQVLGIQRDRYVVSRKISLSMKKQHQW